MPPTTRSLLGCLDIRDTRSRSQSLSAPRLSPSEAEAFNAGFECAFNGGDELSDNPYDSATLEFCSFNDGFAYWFEHDAEIARSRADELHRKVLAQQGQDPVLAKLENLDMATVARRIDIPLADWPGRCYEIACKLVKLFGWQERAAPVYGLFHGAISPKCTLFSGMSRHGWLVLKDGRIVDPTRWVFEAREPALTVFVPGSQEYEEALSDYDEGGERLAQLTAMPAFNPNLPPLVIPPEVGEVVQRVVAEATRTFTAPPAVLSHDQLSWLARTPFNRLGAETAKALFEWFESRGLSALIPVDTMHRLVRLRRWGTASYEALAA